MRIGALRHQVVIQHKTVTRDEYGAEIVRWVDFLTVWASVEPVSGREYFLANQMQAAVDHKITMRYKSGITAGMRVTWTPRAFDIKAILNKEERNVELTLMCQEFVT